MTTTAWDHLPNAVHIDRVIASAKANPTQWGADWEVGHSAEMETAWHKAWRESWDTMQLQYRGATWDAAAAVARDTLQSAAVGGVLETILALITYEDCAYLIDSAPDDIRMLAMLGDHCAMLLLTACKIFHSISSNNQLT